MPVMSDGIRSGVNWIAAERQVHGVGQGADHERLGQPRHADEQAVALGEQGDEQLLEDVLLADDDLGALGQDALGALAEPVGGPQVVRLQDCDVDGWFGGAHAGISNATTIETARAVRRPAPLPGDDDDPLGGDGHAGGRAGGREGRGAGRAARRPGRRPGRAVRGRPRHHTSGPRPAGGPPRPTRPGGTRRSRRTPGAATPPRPGGRVTPAGRRRASTSCAAASGSGDLPEGLPSFHPWAASVAVGGGEEPVAGEGHVLECAADEDRASGPRPA